MGSCPTQSSFIESLVCHTTSELQSTVIDPQVASQARRPRSSSESLNSRAPPHVERTGIPQAEPLRIGRSRTFHTKAHAARQPKSKVASSDALIQTENQEVSETSRKQFSGSDSNGLILGLPGIIAEPHTNARTAPNGLVRTWTLPKLTASKDFLPQYWRCPPGVRYYKSTPEALKYHTQRSFELMVTAGYLHEDDKGFHWTHSTKYELFKCREDALANTAEKGDQESGRPPSAQELRAEPKSLLTRDSAPTSATPVEQEPAASSEMGLWDRRAATRRSSLLKFRTPRYPWNADENESDARFIALFPRWTFPQNARYKEDKPWFPYMSRSDIEDAVTAGYLIEDSVGLRIAHSHQYKLLYVGEGIDEELLDSVPAKLLPKLKCPANKKRLSKKERPLLCDGHDLSEDMPLFSPQIRHSTITHISPPGTPIVERESINPERPKYKKRSNSLLDQGLGHLSPRYTPSIRINASSISLDSMGVASEERVVDDQAKWGRMREEHRKEKQRQREEREKEREDMARLRNMVWRHPHAARD